MVVCMVQARMAEVVQTCTLLVTGRLEEVLDPVQQPLKYPAVQLDRLIIILTKFRLSAMPGCFSASCSDGVYQAV